MSKLRAIGGQDIQFFGYGGPRMKTEGFQQAVDMDIDQCMDKTFYTFRKTKSFKEAIYYRWHFLNFINKHYSRSTEQVYDTLMDQKVCKKIFQRRPSLVLNIDNEYMTFLLMDELRRFYANSAVDMPQRHYLNRFTRHFR